MSDTIKRPVPKYWRKEATSQRRLSVRLYRRRANRALRAGLEVPPFKGTGGRLTW